MTRRLFLLALLATALAGCGGGGGGSNTGSQPTIRAYNAISDAATAQFRVDEESLGGPVAFRAPTSEHRAYDVGDYDLTVTPAGDPVEADRVVFEPTFDADYVAVAFGLRAYGDEIGKRPQIGVTRVDRASPNGDKARLLVFNALVAASGAENAPIDVVDGDNAQFPVNGIDYGNLKPLVVDSGALTYQARATGSDQVFATGTETLARGGVYLVLVSGQLGGTGTAAPTITYLPLQTRL